MYYIKFVFYVSLVLFMVGCSSKPKLVNSADEKFSQKAISIKYSSSEKLNMYDNQSHVIPLVVYQLNDINHFNSLIKDKDGIIKLLAAKKFDQSVMSVNKFYISSNKTKELLLDRASKTTWIALVAGYYDMEPSQSTLKYQIPPYNEFKFWKSESKQRFLTIKVYFDKSSIQQKEE